MLLGKVILDIQTSSLSKPFTYAICDKSRQNENTFNSNVFSLKNKFLEKIDVDNDYVFDNKIEIGCIVVVPFGSQIRTGFLIDIIDDSCAELEVNLPKIKPILYALTGPYFNKSKVNLAKQMSSKYFAPFVSCLRLFIPSGVNSKSFKYNNKWKITLNEIAKVNDVYIVKGDKFDDYKPRKNAVKQKLILGVLNNGEIKLSELKHEFGSVDNAVKALKKAKAIDTFERRKIRANFSEFSYENDNNYKDFRLTSGQSKALESITKKIEMQKHHVFVLDGVTGSGKTEVYLRAIQNVLNKGKTACVLVPEISLTPQAVARFRSRFGENVAVLHSKMSVGERYDQWDSINDGKANVVIGTRSALFSPLNNIGLIVIDEEHENSYKQETSPRYHARDCALMIAEQQNCVLVLGSATPSIETLFNANKLNNWSRVDLPERTNKKPLPQIEIVDMSQEFKGGRKSLFSHKLSEQIKEELSKNNKVVLFHNRRGFASYMFCRNCGFSPKCPNCSNSLTYHQKILVDDFINGYPTKVNKEMLVCHHCGHMQHVYIRCPECDSPYIAKYGAGTQSVEEQLKAILTELPNADDVNIVRMDADTTRKKYGHQTCLEEFAKTGPAVLLGTQMIAKGLDFDDVTLVGVVLVDTNLCIPDFRSEERTFNLILQVAGRAGRAKLPGKVIVQTYSPKSDCVLFASDYNKKAFLENELFKRKMLNYPPFCNLANLIISGFDENQVSKTAKDVEEKIQKKLNLSNINDVVLMPASSCVLSKIRNKFRYHILIKFDDKDSLIKIFSDFKKLYKLPANISLVIDVDPLSLL